MSTICWKRRDLRTAPTTAVPLAPPPVSIPLAASLRAGGAAAGARVARSSASAA
jgi:hypothetical protein